MSDNGYWERDLPSADADFSITAEGDDEDPTNITLSQSGDFLFVERLQAEKLIELLQSWLRGEIA